MNQPTAETPTCLGAPHAAAAELEDQVLGISIGKPPALHLNIGILQHYNVKDRASYGVLRGCHLLVSQVLGLWLPGGARLAAS